MNPDDVVIHYSADLARVLTDLKKLERVNQQLAKEFGSNFAKASQVVSSSLEKVTAVPTKVKSGKGFKEVQKLIVQTGTVVKLTDGKFKNFGETLTFVEGKLKRTKNAVKDVTKQMQKQQAATNKTGKATKTFAQNVSFLTKRALTVIPVWLVLRSVFTGFTRVLNSSIKFLIDWEFQLAQIKIVGKESAESIDILSDSMLSLATSLGISNDQLGEAAKLFIQQGRAAKDILPLLDATAKLSLLTGNTMVKSVEDLTAILKAFNIDAERSITVIDLITNVMLCFDPETELLTDNGWKTYKTISKKDKVFSLNLNNKNASYEKIDSIFINKNYNGKMAKYSNKINFMVTPNHKFPISSNNSQFYKKLKFKLREIVTAPNQFNIPSNCIWDGKNIKFFTIPKYETKVPNPRNTFKFFHRKWKPLTFKMSDWLEFLGWYISEGSICGRSINISQYESVHAKEVQSIKALLKRMKIDYRYDGKQFWLKGKLAQLRHWLKHNCYDGNQIRNCYSKSIPKFVTTLSSKQIMIFLDTFIKGDGTVPKKHSPVLYTVSTKLMNDLTELIVKVGKTPSCTKHGNIYHVIMSSKQHHMLFKNNIQYVDYKGLIWCVETNPHHTIYARRNGTCYWSGNSNAITAGDLTAAYKQVASTASVLGISLAGLTGYITAIKAETRDAGGKIGLALRTMFTRITTVSADAIQSLTGIPLFLDATGKATTTATNKLRNLERVISDLSIVFAGLGNAQQIQLAKQVAGVRRTNQAIVLFKNFNQVIKSQTDALLGLGKADRAIEILVDTTKIRIQSMTNAWKEFVDTVGDTGVIKAAIDFLKTQIQGLNTIIDSDRAFFTGLRKELQDIGIGFQRDAQLARNFTELLGITGNLSDQLGLADANSEFELIKDRVQIIVNQIQAFNRLSEGIQINIEPTLDADDLNRQLEAQKERFVDIQVQAQLNFERTELQDQFVTIGRELQLIFQKIPFKPGESLTAEGEKIRNSFLDVKKIIGDITKGKFITQDQLDKVTQFANRYKLTNDEAVGLERKFNQLSATQTKLIDSSGRELQIRKEITREVDREVAKRRSAEQVANDLFKLEISSIRENKTKQQLLESQLEILERQDQVLTDQLENRLKSIRKELEKIRAVEEQQILKTLINDQLERLKLAGALNSVILKRKTALEDQFKISRTVSENLNRQLQIQRDITKENRLSPADQLSSETIKLFRIARDEGVETAKKIGEVLNKEISFSEFVRLGGDAVDIFKKEFGAIFEQEQAKAFFEGLTVPGEKGLRGGFSITTEEKVQNKLIGSQTSLTSATLSLRNAISALNVGNAPRTSISSLPRTPAQQYAQQTLGVQVTTPVNITVDVSSLAELASTVEDKLVKNIPIVGSKAYEAVKSVVLKV